MDESDILEFLKDDGSDVDDDGWVSLNLCSSYHSLT